MELIRKIQDIDELNINHFYSYGPLMTKNNNLYIDTIAFIYSINKVNFGQFSTNMYEFYVFNNDYNLINKLFEQSALLEMRIHKEHIYEINFELNEEAKMLLNIR